MIAGPIQENLRLVFEPTKGTRVNNARPIALKLGAKRMSWLREFTAARIT